jgi:hypothetical protein
MTTLTRWLPSDRRTRMAVVACLLALSLAAAVAVLGPARSAVASLTDRGAETETPATRHVPSSEQQGVTELDYDRIAEQADPVPMPSNVPLPPAAPAPQRP